MGIFRKIRRKRRDGGMKFFDSIAVAAKTGIRILFIWIPHKDSRLRLVWICRDSIRDRSEYNGVPIDSRSWNRPQYTLETLVCDRKSEKKNERRL